jgi:hypothetical protein
MKKMIRKDIFLQILLSLSFKFLIKNYYTNNSIIHNFYYISLKAFMLLFSRQFDIYINIHIP